MAADQGHRWDFTVGVGVTDERGNAVDTVRTFDPERKIWYEKPLRGEPYEAPDGQVFPSEWHYTRQIEDLKRGVEACDFRLEHLDDPTPWFMGEPPTAEQLARRRAEIESEKAAALAEIERLEPASLRPPPSSGRRRRSG
jgi:hypothetical protein